MNESLMARIRGVKGLVDSTNENEAAVAATLLQKMLQDNNLEMSEIGEAPEENPVTDEFWSEVGKVYVGWKTNLASIVATSTFCRLILSHRFINGNAIAVTIFVGHKKDAEVAQYLYETLVSKITQLAKKRTAEYIVQYRAYFGCSPTNVGGSAHPTVYRNSWLLGALVTIGETMREESQRFKSQPTANALVVTKRKEVGLFVREQFPYLGKSSTSFGSRTRNEEAYAQGRSDGRSIQVNRAIGSNGRRSLQLGEA